MNPSRIVRARPSGISRCDDSGPPAGHNLTVVIEGEPGRQRRWLYRCHLDRKRLVRRLAAEQQPGGEDQQDNPYRCWHLQCLVRLLLTGRCAAAAGYMDRGVNFRHTLPESTVAELPVPPPPLH